MQALPDCQLAIADLFSGIKVPMVSINRQLEIGNRQ